MFPTTKYMKHILCVESYKATKIKKNCTTKNDLSEYHPKNKIKIRGINQSPFFRG